MRLMTQLRLGFSLVAVLMLLSIALNHGFRQTVLEAQQAVEHRHESLEAALLIEAVFGELPMQGYPDAASQETLRQHFISAIERLRQQVEGDLAQIDRLIDLDRMIEHWQRLSAGQPESAFPVILALRDPIKALVAGERHRLAQYQKAAMASQTQAYFSLLGSLALIVLLGLGVLLLLTRSIWRQLGGDPSEIAVALKRIARGDLDITSQGEEGLAGSVALMSHTLKEVARQANMIAVGNYSADIAPRSDKDELGRALQTMHVALRRAHETSAGLDWLKSGIARLNDTLSGDPGLEQLSSLAIREIALYLDAQVGALYIAQQDHKLRLQGAYAYSFRKNLSNEFNLGESLVGQAALEKLPILIRNVPDDYVRVTSGLGERIPNQICVTPFLYENRLKGVVEIGTLGEISREQLDYLSQAMQLLATAVESAQARDTRARLLEESQRLTEELQVQQEELKTANAELEEQSQRLRNSEQRLQAQQTELEVSNADLEQKNELLERQKWEVEQARKVISLKAEELALASKYKSEFLANMSHELRTPLNSLLLLAQNLGQNREGNLTSDQVESARVIHASGTDLLNLINEILDLSKIEAGRMDLKPDCLSIAELAEGLRVAFAHIAEDKGLSWDVRVASDAPATLVTDQQRLEQILRNLVSNAIKFTDAGGVTVLWEPVTAGIRPTQGDLLPKNCLAIRVQDTGIGIAADQHRQIFEAFQQADGGTARRYGGTGLGLTISRELAILMGGEIQLVSEPGQGSCFSLILPLEPVRSASPPAGGAELPSILPTQPATATPLLTQARRLPIADDRQTLQETDRIILVIEDDAYFADILSHKCHEKGFKCLATPTGEAGLELAIHHQPCAIILDIRLPDMDGMAVLSALKEDIRTRHIPVHVVSIDDCVHESLLKGAVGHAIKPIDQDHLEDVFRRLEQLSVKPRRVLVIEDEPVTRRKTVELIADTDVQVDEAATGTQALEALRRTHYDCVILDLKLPDLDGATILDILEREGVAVPPVIVHTARDLSNDEELGLREHAESIVIKDVRSPERLLDEVSLFLHQVVNQMPEPKRKIIRDLHDPDMPLRGKKILVVDDDMRTIFALSRLLAERGLQVVRAEHGERALQLLDEHPDVDLVLMDVMMPVMDGYTAMRSIRAQERFRKLPIIALTAKAMPDDRKCCLDAGASDYLTKPLDAQQMFSMMRIWLYG